MKFESTKIIELGSCAFRQWKADSHCKFIHGYRLIGKFWFECNHLDEKNWVVDFGGLKELKQVLEKQFDHTLCIAGDDPLLNHFEQLHKLGAVDLRIMPRGVGIERTAEFCFEIADSHIRGITNNRCWVKRVEVWEHDKNSAIVSYEYRGILENKDIYVADSHQKQETISTTISPVLENVNTTGAGINVSKPVPLQTRVTGGMGNPFGGTSWGV
jgi:6-pyruvoyltetrahydropterin/6-carboxytetrahydropterin synthase